MPISRQEFDDGRTNLNVPILQYLGVRRDEAFTADEILAALLDVYGRRAMIAEDINFLRNLADAGRIETREIAGTLMNIIIKTPG